MPEDNNQRTQPGKSRKGALLGGLLLLLGVLWGVGADRVLTENRERIPVIEKNERRKSEEKASSEAILDRLHLVSRLPDVYSSEDISGEGVRGQLVGDRAFWLTQPDGLRKTLVVVDSAAERSRIRVGETVWISGQVFQTSGLNESSMAELSAETQAVLNKERAFIYSRKLVSRGLGKNQPGIALTKPD
jgi:hypothetical protein